MKWVVNTVHFNARTEGSGGELLGSYRSNGNTCTSQINNTDNTSNSSNTKSTAFYLACLFVLDR